MIHIDTISEYLTQEENQLGVLVSKVRNPKFGPWSQAYGNGCFEINKFTPQCMLTTQ